MGEIPFARTKLPTLPSANWDSHNTLVVASLETPAAIGSGQTSEGIVVDLDSVDVPWGVLRVVFDEEDLVDECREDNNEVVLEGLCE